jgi:hypothetical protein
MVGVFHFCLLSLDNVKKNRQKGHRVEKILGFVEKWRKVGAQPSWLLKAAPTKQQVAFKRELKS